MKNANGDGSVYKMKDKKRRNPWRAVVVTDWKYDEKNKYVPVRKTIGYYSTRTEAMDALSEYRKKPYDIDAKKLTFSDIYDKWSAVHFEKVSASSARGYKSAYNHSEPLHSMVFADIRPVHLDECIRSADVCSSTKNAMRNLYSQLYKWALKNEICSTNYAAMCDSITPDEPQKERKPITEAEEAALWKMYKDGEPYADMVLIQIYSGWRPQELCLLQVEDIDMDEKTFRGGIKTKAGKNRIVPIHDQIFPLVAARIGERTEGRLFLNSKGKGVSYESYRRHFSAIMDRIDASHSPHDARHTFITKAKEADMNEYVLKLIVGHAIADLTEKVYTHRGLERLRSEIAKIQQFGTSEQPESVCNG